MSKAIAAVGARRTNYSSAESTAEIIFKAATDGTGQVMYLAGQDAEQIYDLTRNASEAQKLAMVLQHSGL